MDADVPFAGLEQAVQAQTVFRDINDAEQSVLQQKQLGLRQRAFESSKDHLIDHETLAVPPGQRAPDLLSDLAERQPSDFINGHVASLRPITSETPRDGDRRTRPACVLGRGARRTSRDTASAPTCGNSR